ncbi:MAG: ribosome assembly RNA-binding protein YhbY [Oscillospiraceae bacterium]|jgi:RNA-binding protein|nr:ribosome assembly RNA-binding protein YhbY [Oscillospiraceae bacterium]MCI1990659.1 ribosome assembly RNA-binding protein YhbY [Oscillospiraceae bacterium]MCI2035252.1 ribosome assembly RNA-binding protein YhbY [Oscillospiraceae bacterium]
MLTGKQRAYLRSLANSMETILLVGKGGIGADVIKQADGALAARELIKGKVLENSPVTPREAADRIAAATSSEAVQVIGSKFVLYRKREKESKIVLPKTRKK